jgi:hypothetical protein
MASPKDLHLVPNQYEVIRLDTGQEIMGMTRRLEGQTEVTLPMMCHLSATMKGRTIATFYPYSPLSSDTTVTIPDDMILHRNTLNKQIVPFYDNASSKWLNMVETGTIPLDNNLPIGDQVDVRSQLDDLVKRMMDMQRHPEEEDLEWLEAMQEELDLERDEYEDFFSARPPKDKKKIH